jgi:ribosomal protein S18 acetylase RimI-like enzyme
MPQTSLLSFLTSSVGGTSGCPPAPRPWAASFKTTQHESSTIDPSARTAETEGLSKASASCARLSQSSDHVHTDSLAANLDHGIVSEAVTPATHVEEEEGQGLEENSGSISSNGSSMMSTKLRAPAWTDIEHRITLTLPHCPSITITSIQPSHLPALKRLTSALLPIKYPDTFYDLALSDPISAALSRIALYTPSIINTSNATFTQTPTSTPTPVGWIRCSLEPCPSPQQHHSPQHQIYIKALCLLAPYRGLGVATALLDTILQQQKETLRTHGVKTVFAHVWERNDEALQWYEKRGFARDGGLIEGYYRKLRPQGAWIVRREVG